MREHDTPEIPYGYCQCGCGQKTAISDRTDPVRGVTKGEPRRFVLAHSSRGVGGYNHPFFDDALGCWKVQLHTQDGSRAYTLFDEVDLPLIQDRSWRLGRNTRRPDNYYVWGWENGKNITMQKVIFPDAETVDHINRDTLDNRRANLRRATRLQNAANKGMSAHNTSGLIGVNRDHNTGLWRAQIRNGGRNEHLGSFSDQIEAARVYDKRAVELRGEFAVTNEALGLIAAAKVRQEEAE